MNEKGKEISISIEFNNPCMSCNGDCDACGYYVDQATPDEIEAEAAAFRLNLRINPKKHTEVTVNI